MTNTSTHTLTKESPHTPWLWVFVALGSHTAWGIYPVLTRYLQTVSNLPTFSILTFANVLVLVVMGGYLLRHVDANLFRMPIIWLYMAIVVIRAVTNISSTRFTLSIYIQLIAQATPFIVILMSTLILKEQLPRFTVPAISIALIGAVMMVGPDFGSAPEDPTRRDWLGISLALLSITSLAGYMILVRRSVKHHVSGESLMLVQTFSIAVVTFITSLIVREDWSQYTRLSIKDWGILLGFSLFVLLGANFGQILSLQHIGAPLVSSMLATRLISSLLFGGLLLGEKLESIWQMIGAGIVLVTITWFLWQQRK